jgi:hypothetical protein
MDPLPCISVCFIIIIIIIIIIFFSLIDFFSVLVENFDIWCAQNIIRFRSPSSLFFYILYGRQFKLNK